MTGLDSRDLLPIISSKFTRSERAVSLAIDPSTSSGLDFSECFIKLYKSVVFDTSLQLGTALSSDYTKSRGFLLIFQFIMTPLCYMHERRSYTNLQISEITVLDYYPYLQKQ